MKILVVDDEPSIRFYYRLTLKKISEIFQEANDGYEGIEFALQDDYDIIIMDYRMPGMDGLSACKTILAMKPESKIILISADADIERIAFENGVKAFLLKPVTKSLLQETIEKVYSFTSS